MADPYRILTKPGASAEIDELRSFDARRVVRSVNEELKFEPAVQTNRRKQLDGVSAAFTIEPPLWELKVGEYRVYYDVDEVDRLVVVRAVRYKGIRTTDEVLR